MPAMAAKSERARVDTAPKPTNQTTEPHVSDGPTWNYAVEKDLALGRASSTAAAGREQIFSHLPSYRLSSSTKHIHELAHWPYTMPAKLDDVSTSSFSVKNVKVDRSSRRRRTIPLPRNVHFKEEQTVFEFDRADDDEREHIWYSRTDYDVIKSRNSLIVKMMKTGNFQESNVHSFRGLEHKLKEGFKQRRANKFNALNAVLEEQDRQYARGNANTEAIADAYFRVSQHTRQKAFMMGLRDAESSWCFKGMVISGDISDVSLDDDDEEDVQDCEGTVASDDSGERRGFRRMFAARRRRPSTASS